MSATALHHLGLQPGCRQLLWWECAAWGMRGTNVPRVIGDWQEGQQDGCFTAISAAEPDRNLRALASACLI